MPKEDNNGKGIHLTDEQWKAIIIMIRQHGDEIDDLWDCVFELKAHAIAAGMPVKDVQKWQDSARKREQTSAMLKVLRQRFFDGLGLD
jgi:hypothetical protein